MLAAGNAIDTGSTRSPTTVSAGGGAVRAWQLGGANEPLRTISRIVDHTSIAAARIDRRISVQ
jgi:hypothetical protein